MAKKKVKESEREPKVPIEWHIPDYIITRFASNMVVQIIENEFKISFFELNPQIQLDPTKPPDKIRADCVASVIVPVYRLPKFIKALQKQVDLYEAEIKPLIAFENSTTKGSLTE